MNIDKFSAGDYLKRTKPSRNGDESYIVLKEYERWDPLLEFQKVTDKYIWGFYLWNFGERDDSTKTIKLSRQEWDDNGWAKRESIKEMDLAALSSRTPYYPCSSCDSYCESCQSSTCDHMLYGDPGG